MSRHASQPAIAQARMRGALSARLGYGPSDGTVLESPPPVPAPGTSWTRLTRSERQSAIMAALAAGRGPANVASDYDVHPGTSQYSYLRRQFAGLRPLADHVESHSGPRSEPPPLVVVGVLVGALSDATCRWPLWDHGVAVPSCHEARYCGSATEGRPPYCAHHSHVRLRHPGRPHVSREPSLYRYGPRPQLR